MPDEKAKESAKSSSGRLTFLDWARGCAVATMLQGHVFHSFNKVSLRTDGPFTLSQFFGGMGPAVFLVLTGVTLAFLMDARERAGVGPMGRWKASLKRAGYLFMLAFLFRLQLWLFAQPQSWTALFKVDILNCMGFAIALMSIMAIFTTAERVRLCAVLGMAIAAAAPLVSAIDWNWMPVGLSMYFVPSFDYFAFFPWASFIAFGLSIGSMIRLVPADQMNRMMQWGSLAGLSLVAGGEYFSNNPYSLYPKTDYWLNSPGLIVIKLGVVLLLLAFAFLWTEYAVGNSWSWVRQLGTTSLLVYWVHIELVYGRWFGGLKENLNNIESAIAAAVVIALMVALSVARTRWTTIHTTVLAPFFSFNRPNRVSGD